MAALKQRKRESDKVDALMAKVEDLVNKGSSVNKACKVVGLQPTVYYFRKRKEEAARKVTKASPGPSLDVNLIDDKLDVNELIKEARELEQRLTIIKIKLGEKALLKDNGHNNGG